MAKILIPVPADGFDPTEVAVPWKTWRGLGHRIVFATPDGRTASADPRMVTGEGLGVLATLLRADSNGRAAYAAVRESLEFRHPIAWRDIGAVEVDALFLPGGHAPGMKPYLESAEVQAKVVAMFSANLPVGAICHGVLVAARSRDAGHPQRGFTVRDGLYLSARWPGDAHRFASEFSQLMADAMTPRAALSPAAGPAG
jgi:protease I